MAVSFDVTSRDQKIIHKIAARAFTMALKYDEDYPTLEATMDVVATHANGNPLRLDGLLAADDFNFAHDVFGIRRHLDRETGKLGGCFRPRFSQLVPALNEGGDR